MSGSADNGPSQAGQPERRPSVRMLTLVACRHCRRRRGAQLASTGAVEAVPDRGTCPHGKPLRTLWAPGYGPTAEPPEDPSTPDGRRRGPV
ncbi:conserved hypothetical protein [Frankia canadensis]|uniref:Uncharacterized protein n=1 Tax=Frankia canadensis TaxID=1836972 RepID=A0A2I2KM54_9ACTN|nr:conserved hypothetical protein [Frankia canadensis]SOU54016.1 conserved hypothetical protein [Frankia canadensis]